MTPQWGRAMLAAMLRPFLRFGLLTITALGLTGCRFTPRKVAERTWGNAQTGVSVIQIRNRPAWLLGTERLEAWKLSQGTAVKRLPLSLDPSYLPRLGAGLSPDERWVRLAYYLPEEKTGQLRWRDIDGDGELESSFTPLPPGHPKARVFRVVPAAYLDLDHNRVLTARDDESTRAQREAGLFMLRESLRGRELINGAGIEFRSLPEAAPAAP